MAAEDKKDLIEISQLIERAKALGIKLGKGDPRNRLRYFTKLGLLPNAQRITPKGIPIVLGKPPLAVGAYPVWVLERLAEIDKLKEQGKSFVEIKRIVEFYQPKIKPALPRKPLSQKIRVATERIIVACGIIGILIVSYFSLPFKSQQFINKNANNLWQQARTKLSGILITPPPQLPLPQPSPGQIAGIEEPLSVTDYKLTAVNLLRNSSFEANNSGQPRLWTYYNQSTEKNTFVTQEGVHTGGNGLKFAGSASSPYLGIYQPEVKTDWNKAYSLSAWVKVLNAPQISIRLGFWDKLNNQRAGVKEFEVSKTADWFRISTTVDNDTTWQGKTWFPLIEIYGLTQGSVYLDDIQLEESAGPTFYHALSGALLGDGSITTDAQGTIYPTQDAVGDLGKSGGRWRKLQLFQASINEDGNASFAGSLSAGSINSNLTPNANNTYNLGSSTTQWNQAFINTLSVTSCTGCGVLDAKYLVTEAHSSLTNEVLTTSLNSSLIPSANNTYDLGSSSYQWNNLYVANLNVGGSDISGTKSETFTLDSDNTGGNLSLIFGATNNERLTWDATNARFNLTDDLLIDNTLSVTGATTLSSTLSVTGNTTLTGDLTVNGGDITSTATTFNLVNATATTVNFAGAATSLSLGTSTGTLTLNNPTVTATNVTAFNCTDCIDFDDMKDTLALDTSQTLNQGGSVWIQNHTGSDVIGFTYNANSITTGVAMAIRSTSSFFRGRLLDLDVTHTQSSSTMTNAENILRVNRTSTVSGATTTLTLSGDVAGISSNCTQASGGTCTDTANILELNQQYASATGAVLNILNSGTGADIAFNTSPILRMSDGGTMIWDDGTNTLMSLADVGTTGNLTLSGKEILSSLSLSSGGDERVSNDVTFNPSAGGSQYGYKLDVTNAPTTATNTAYGMYIGITDETSLANTIYGLYVNNNLGTDGYGKNRYGVYAVSEDAAIYGRSNNLGVHGYSSSTNAIGVEGEINNDAGGTGVSGIVSSATCSSCFGVRGSGGPGTGVSASATTGTALIANLTGAGAAIASFQDNGTNIFWVADSATDVLVFEGATANDFETTFRITDPTADRLISFPDAGGTVCISGQTCATSGIVGYWSRSGTTLSPATANDIVAISTVPLGSTGLTVTTANVNSGTTTAIAGTTGTITTAGTQNAFLATLGAISAGTANGYNLSITNPTGGTINGFNFPTISGGGATINAINIGNMTGGAGAETAINIGAGWDTGINISASPAESAITITSNLTAARSTDVMTITQPNDATNNSTGNLLQLTNSDTGSTVAVLDISQVTGGTWINLTGDVAGNNARGINFSSPVGNGFLGTAIGINLQGVLNGATGISVGAIEDSAVGVSLEAASLTSGQAISIGGQLTTSATEFSGDVIRINPTKTYTGSGTLTDSGNFLDIARSNTINDPLNTGNYVISGDLVTFSSNCTVSAGGETCTDTSNILELNQQYASASGAVLNILNSGTGADIAFNTTPTLTIGDTGTLTIADGTNTLITLADAGTTGNLTVTGNLTAGSGVTSGTTTLDIGGTGTSYALCHATQTGTDNEGVVDCTSAPQADYAEMYSVEPGIEYGDLVATGQGFVTTTDGQRLTKLTKSIKPYQNNIIGIVSNNYGDFTSAGYNIKSEDNPMPVALSGRVPVKVSTENGSIEPGDFITSSSTPGVAMKATVSGRVIGIALEEFSISNFQFPNSTQNSNELNFGKILIFVNPTFYLGDVTTDGSLAEAGNIESDKGQGTRDKKAFSNNQTTTLSFDLIQESNSNNLINQLIEILKGLGITIKQNFLAVAEAVIDKLTVKEILIDNSKDEPGDKPIVGQGVILSGATEIEIPNSKVNQNSRVFLTFRGDPQEIGWSIAKIVDGEAFTVKITKSLSQDLIFDYWIIQTTAQSKQIRSQGQETGSHPQSTDGKTSNNQTTINYEPPTPNYNEATNSAQTVDQSEATQSATTGVDN
jgi:hypothetical protein